MVKNVNIVNYHKMGNAIQLTTKNIFKINTKYIKTWCDQTKICVTPS